LAKSPSRALQQIDRAINDMPTTTLARIEQRTAHSEPIPVVSLFSGVVQGRPAKILGGQPVGPSNIYVTATRLLLFPICRIYFGTGGHRLQPASITTL